MPRRHSRKLWRESRQHGARLRRVPAGRLPGWIAVLALRRRWRFRVADYPLFCRWIDADRRADLCREPRPVVAAKLRALSGDSVRPDDFRDPIVGRFPVARHGMVRALGYNLPPLFCGRLQHRGSAPLVQLPNGLIEHVRRQAADHSFRGMLRRHRHLGETADLVRPSRHVDRVFQCVGHRVFGAFHLDRFELCVALRLLRPPRQFLELYAQRSSHPVLVR
mmetsp:Transcript_102043/g.200144  ORF Transcript_102043/g.200144 Transcript_102043/m.200144 type:complete len:221 (-) Transcript_102043:625-1287(-)